MHGRRCTAPDATLGALPRMHDAGCSALDARPWVRCPGCTSLGAPPWMHVLGCAALGARLLQPPPPLRAPAPVAHPAPAGAHAPCPPGTRAQSHTAPSRAPLPSWAAAAPQACPTARVHPLAPALAARAVGRRARRHAAAPTSPAQGCFQNCGAGACVRARLGGEGEGRDGERIRTGSDTPVAIRL
eukprot:364843-Chlamydomonas_euryale.AAC.15